VEGTLGAVDLVLFRERAGEAALQGVFRESGVRWGELVRKRPFPHGRRSSVSRLAVNTSSRHRVSESNRLG